MQKSSEDALDAPISSVRLVAIAASAGSLPALFDVLAPLPASFPAAIAIVQHRGMLEPERLIELLANRTRLRVQHAVDGAVLEPGTVYVCPPGVHMTTEHSVRLVPGPRLNFVRPNADLMLESMSRAYGERAIVVVLSGLGSDAALGSVAIARAGGTVIAQDDRTCTFPDMPNAAARVGAVKHVLTPAEIALELERLVDARAWARPSHEITRDPAAPISVVLADDHRIVLDGLRVLLDREPGISVISEIEDGAAAVEVVASLQPDVVVMDLRMPGLSGVEATREIVARTQDTRVVALSAQHDAASVESMLRAGASGYLTKHRAFGELAQAIRRVVEGHTYLCEDIARMVLSGEVSTPPTRPHRRL